MGEIFSLYVYHASREKGFGTLLLEAAHQWLLEEGCTDVSLWVATENDLACSFLEHRNFLEDEGVTKEVVYGKIKIKKVRLFRPLT
jgi:GNAT superfamily N-acetyltransferase